MPDLSSIRDTEELENRYLDKVIIYVEADADEEVFRRIAGPALAGRLEFKTPRSEGSGFNLVFDRVRTERPSNGKIFGLVDGEAAVTVGGLNELLNSDDALFSLPGKAEVDGILFLEAHELENLLLMYGDICEHICRDVRLADLNSHSVEDVRQKLSLIALRFFGSAVLKYSALEMRRSGKACEIVPAGTFLSRDETMRILREVKQRLIQTGEWGEFRATFLEVTKRLRDRFDRENLSSEAKRRHLLRLADGKSLLNRLRQHYNTNGRWDGHLVDSVTRNAYAAKFSNCVIKNTAA
ncbi:hypothetical protein CO661_31945 [Sinorhizobium fredii]|uniref:DUF4435 domain-containing protein n=1 Tax=Rhizobium fredii TaxID=380 RepID=A0A2A6LNU7_RHIFR|nr:hypothetical protein [Sinorhizobium fredii]PDT43977.1 hypothetical protein CO661_31945 [Sinorhizobium fredii]